MDEAVTQLTLARDIRGGAKGTASQDFAFASLNLAMLLARQLCVPASNEEPEGSDATASAEPDGCAEPDGSADPTCDAPHAPVLPVLTRIAALAAEAQGIAVANGDTDAVIDMIEDVLDLLDAAGPRKEEEEALVARVRDCFFELTGEVWGADAGM